MTDVRVRMVPQQESIQSTAHAAEKLEDAPYIAFVLVQAAKLLVTLLGKRWPNLR